MNHSKPTLLFVLHLPPPIHGAAMVGKYIHDSQLISESFNCKFVNLAMAGNLENIGKFSFSKITSLFKLLKVIRREIKTTDPKFVYVTPNAGGNAFYKDYIVVQYIKLLGKRVVMHFHNKGVEKNSHSIINNYLYKKYFNKAKVILLSESLYPDFKSYVNIEEVFFCPNGIPDVKVDRHEENPKCRIMFLSNLIISKGVLDLLDACKILIDKKADFECVFIGGETDEMNTERFNEEVGKRGIQGVVTYLGRKVGEEKNTELEKADVFVFPTFYPNECFPLVLLEAMQHGLPCVSTQEGAIPDIIENGENGFLVEKHSPKEIADALGKIISSKELRLSMGMKAREKYEKFYKLEKFESLLCSIFQSLLKE